MAFAPTRKPRWTGLPFTHKNGDFGAISVGTVRSKDADGNENVKKTIGLISKTTTLHVHHAFLYISLKFYFSYCTWIW